MRLFSIIGLMLILITSCNKDYVEINELEIQDYLADRSLTADRTESGLYYKIINIGDEVMPNATDEVTVNYTGTLLDGSVFDEGVGISFPLNGVIAGWTEGVQLIGTGGKITLYIPSHLAYGENPPNNNIPKNAVLIFEVELTSINLALESYIALNEIDVLQTNSGLFYEIIDAGNTVKPTEVDNVTVNYTGRFINDLIFEEGSSISFPLDGVIAGWEEGLQLIGEGGTINLYIPSFLAYGSQGTGSIPPNTPLIFEVNLLSVN